MMIYDLLDELKNDLHELEPDALEAKYHGMAEDEAGEKIAKQIADISVSDYESDLTDGLSQAIDAANDESCEAIVFEYDMDGDWAGWFYACPDYAHEAVADDDWADEHEEEVEGPVMKAFAKIHAKHGGLDGDEDDEASRGAVTLYLIARTMACLSRAAEQARPEGLAVCAGFTGQDGLWRLREPHDED